MSNIMFLPPKRFSSRLECAINQLIKKQGYLAYEVQRKMLTSIGYSFMCKMYEVDIKGETKAGPEETSLFLKVIKKDVEIKWVSLARLCRIELFTYRKLFPLLDKIQENANIPLQDRFKMIKSYEESNGEMIIMENISKNGYEVCDRMGLISLEFAEISLKQIAKLHALSFALEMQHSDFFNKNLKNMKYPIIFSDDWNQYVKGMINLVVQHVDDDIRSRVECAYNKLADKYASFYEDDEVKRCLIHGDYRSSNVMIKMNNGRITDLVVLDYQTLHYGCPAMDVIQLIFMNSDRKFRKAHMSHLKDLYYENLRTFLEYFNIDVDSVYSRETFEQDFKKKLDYALLISFVWMPMVLADEDEVPDIIGDMSGVKHELSDIYKERQRDMIEDFLEWGYI